MNTRSGAMAASSATFGKDASGRDAVVQSVLSAIEAGQGQESPYRHWHLTGLLPEAMVDEINALPFEAPSLDGVSGKRELHNATRTYFDLENRTRFPVCEAVASGFQDPRVTSRIASHFGTDLDGSYLRIEYAQDVDGFWLEPHTDLGVKLFTLLLYMSRDASHSDLGTDIYDGDKTPVGRSPFAANAALVFVPSDNTYHGFEARPISGVRRSVIINYVTDEWRAREQLAFPENPIGS